MAGDVDLEALSDLQTPWALRVAVTLRLAEHIAEGTVAIDALARVTGSDREALHNLLGHLVAKGVFAEPSPGSFALNAAAEALTDPGLRIGLALDGIGGRMAGAWSTLPGYVRSGSAHYAEVFGRPFWADLAAHPEVAASFDALIGPVGHGHPSGELPLAGGWGAVRHVVDVGGGTGAMVASLLRAHPQLRGTLIDLPGTVARSRELLAAAGVADRVTEAPQSFFDPLPAGADVYLLRGILNDWPDAEALAILRGCAEAAGAHGRVVIMKGIRDDAAPHALVIETVLLGGKQRSLSELSALALEAGLRITADGQDADGTRVVELRAT
jgi:hypothetical protein